MTRSGFRKLWMFVIGVIIIAAFFAYNKASDYQSQIKRKEQQREQLTLELKSGNQLSNALTELDNFTIDEKDLTELDILRYLGLEESGFSFKGTRRSERRIGSTRLYIREFTLSGETTYARALEQADWLHNTNKVSINRVKLEPGKQPGDRVGFIIEGTLYGLDKKSR